MGGWDTGKIRMKVRTVRTFPKEAHEIVRNSEDLHVRYLWWYVTITKKPWITISVMVAAIITAITVIIEFIHSIIVTWPEI